MAAVDLDGLAEQWESNRDIRTRMRENQSLFQQTIGHKNLEVNIAGAEHHVDVLLPLVKMLHLDSGDTGMASIPLLEAEWLAFKNNMLWACLGFFIFKVLRFETSHYFPLTKMTPHTKCKLVCIYMLCSSLVFSQVRKSDRGNYIALTTQYSKFKGPQCSTTIFL